MIFNNISLCLTWHSQNFPLHYFLLNLNIAAPNHEFLRDIDNEVRGTLIVLGALTEYTNHLYHTNFHFSPTVIFRPRSGVFLLTIL